MAGPGIVVVTHGRVRAQRAPLARKHGLEPEQAPLLVSLQVCAQRQRLAQPVAVKERVAEVVMVVANHVCLDGGNTGAQRELARSHGEQPGLEREPEMQLALASLVVANSNRDVVDTRPQAEVAEVIAARQELHASDQPPVDDHLDLGVQVQCELLRAGRLHDAIGLQVEVRCNREPAERLTALEAGSFVGEVAQLNPNLALRQVPEPVSPRAASRRSAHPPPRWPPPPIPSRAGSQRRRTRNAPAEALSSVATTCCQPSRTSRAR